MYKFIHAYVSICPYERIHNAFASVMYINIHMYIFIYVYIEYVYQSNNISTSCPCDMAEGSTHQRIVLTLYAAASAGCSVAQRRWLHTAGLGNAADLLEVCSASFWCGPYGCSICVCMLIYTSPYEYLYVHIYMYMYTDVYGS